MVAPKVGGANRVAAHHLDPVPVNGEVDDDRQDHQHTAPGVGIAPSLATEENDDAIQGVTATLIAS